MRKVLLIFFAVLILACADKPEAKRDVYGVKIQEFKPDLEEVTAGNKAILRLKVQNVGDSDAKKVKAKIYSCGNLAIDNANCPTKEYTLGTGGKLDGADISSNLPGGNAEKTFTVATGGVQTTQNERVEQEIGLKVSYDYESTATAEIPVLSNARYKELERQGTLPKTKVDSALAPINVNIIASEQAIGTEPISLDIELEKEVEGYITGTGCPEGEIGCVSTVKIELSGKGLKKQDCADSTGVQMWRTGKRTFSCLLKPDCSEDECSAVVKVTAKYTYVVETTTSLIVKGTPGGVSLAPGASTAPACGEGDRTSDRDQIDVSLQKGYVTQDIKITGKNFNPKDTNVLIYAEADKYWIENEGDGLIRQTGLGYMVLERTGVTKGSPYPGGGVGINPAADGTFEATYKIPNSIAMYAGGAQANLFAVGEINKDRSITATEGYANCKKLEVEPKALIRVSPSEGRAGEGASVQIRGTNFNGQTATIYFVNPSCANYGGATPIKSGCAKLIGTAPISSGSFTHTFALDENFLRAYQTTGGYTIFPGYYLVYATAGDITEAIALNGAGEFTILPGKADADGDWITDDKDVCSGTQWGVPVCSLEEAKDQTKTECYGRAGCEKLPVEYVKGSIVALKIVSKEETGGYTITYDDKKDYSFVVKKNGVEAQLQKLTLTEIPRAEDILFVFKIKNTASFDITSPLGVDVRGIEKDDLPTQPGHCAGATIWAGKTETCALLVKDIFANSYTTTLKITKDGEEYIKDGFTFTVAGASTDTTPAPTATGTPITPPPTQDNVPPVRSNGQPTATVSSSSATLSLSTGEPATCRYSTSTGVGYDSMTSTTTTSGTTHSWQLTGLSDGTKNYYVRCMDSAGNKNPDDLKISFTVSLPTPTPSPTPTPAPVAQPILLNPSYNWNYPDINGQPAAAFLIDVKDGEAFFVKYKADLQLISGEVDTKGFYAVKGANDQRLVVSPFSNLNNIAPSNFFIVFGIKNTGATTLTGVKVRLTGISSSPVEAINCFLSADTFEPITIAAGAVRPCAYLIPKQVATAKQYDVKLKLMADGVNEYETGGFSFTIK